MITAHVVLCGRFYEKLALGVVFAIIVENPSAELEEVVCLLKDLSAVSEVGTSISRNAATCFDCYRLIYQIVIVSAQITVSVYVCSLG